MPYVIPDTIRGQLSTLIALLIASIAAFIFFYIPAQQKKQALIALQDKAETIAAMTAFSASVAVVFDDRTEVEEVLAGLQNSDDVHYAFVINQTGQTIASIHKSDEISKKENENPLEKYHATNPNILHVESPIMHNQNEIGRIYLGLSTLPLQNALKQSRTTIALVSLSIFVIGLLFVIGISRIITTPLANMADTSLRIAQGDLTRRTDEQYQGEVGQLAHAFNSMVNRVEERTRALQQEVQDRKSAEQALQKSEERIQEILATNPTIIYTCKITKEGTQTLLTPTFVSENLDRIMGYSAQAVLGDAQWWAPKVHPEDLAHLPLVEAELYIKGSSSHEYRFRHQDGTYRWIQDNHRLVRNANGEPQEIIGAWMDITNRKEAELAQEKAEAELEEQRTRAMQGDRLRSLGEMAAGIAHELNQPLVGVRGMAEYTLISLDENWELTPEMLKDRMEEIVQQADRMVHIIQHVRLFAREAGKPDVKPVNVNDVVTSSIDMINAQCQSYGIILQTELSDNLQQTMANPFSLEEVLLNLLNNAQDAVKDQKEKDPDLIPTIHLRTYTNVASHICIEVQDNGGGIPKEIQNKIFDPFFTTKDPDKGTGLGLSISKTITEELGGILTLQTEQENTTLTIQLPPIAS